MDNNQLLYELREINSIENDLDRIIALKEFEKKYKKSNFYEETKMSLKELQEKLLGFKFNEFVDNFMLNFNIVNLGNVLNHVLEEIDVSTFSNFFDKLIESLDIQQLTDAGQVLQEQVKKLQQ